MGDLVKRAWIIGVCVLLTAGIALGVSLLQEKEYTADASLLFRDPEFDEQLFDNTVFENRDPDRDAATNVRLVSLQVVAELTANSLPGGLDDSDVSDRVAIESDPESDVITISATDESPEFAAQIANTFATNYVSFRRTADRAKVRGATRLVKESLAELPPDQRQGAAGQALETQISRLGVLEAVQTGNAELVQIATVPTEASSPKTLRNVLLAGIVGFILGIGLAFAAARLSTSGRRE